MKVAAEANLTLFPSDFNAPLSAAIDGTKMPSCNSLMDKMMAYLANVNASMNFNEDSDITTALSGFLSTLSPDDRHIAQLLISGDIMSDSGLRLTELSSKYGLSEPGVGDNDHYIREGYSSLLVHLAKELNIRYNSPVSNIDWSSDSEVRIRTRSGEVIVADYCICTVPISIIQRESLSFTPTLPQRHLKALKGIKLGLCDKIILRFKERWWPKSPGSILRWYGWEEDAPHVLNWVDWLDLTDGVGKPVLMGFIAGADAIQKAHKGKNDEEIMHAANRSIHMWAKEIQKRQLVL